MYKIVLRPRAAKEYLESIIWYQERSLEAAENFVTAVNTAFTSIELQPASYKKIYKHFREIKLKKYPFTVIYFIDEETKRIVITTIFHNKRNPSKKFER